MRRKELVSLCTQFGAGKHSANHAIQTSPAEANTLSGASPLPLNAHPSTTSLPRRANFRMELDTFAQTIACNAGITMATGYAASARTIPPRNWNPASRTIGSTHIAHAPTVGSDMVRKTGAFSSPEKSSESIVNCSPSKQFPAPLDIARVRFQPLN